MLRKYVGYLFIFGVVLMLGISGVKADINSETKDSFGTNDFVNAEDKEFNWGIDYMSLQNLIYEAKKSKSSVRIAVLDTGFDLNASVFKNVKIESPYDVTGDGDTDVLHPVDSHGTVVAGIIATMIKNTNVILIPVKITDDAKVGVAGYANMERGYKYAIEKKADVINLSFGMYSYDEYSLLRPYYGASFMDFVENGGIFVTASGNENEEISGVKKDYLDLVVVGSTDKIGQRAYFSNYGPSLDFVAPGTDLLLYGSRYHDIFDTFTGGQGTSFSSPQVAGIMSLLKLVYPNKSRDELVNILKGYSIDSGDKGFDIYYGNGIPNLKSLNDYGKRVWKNNGTTLYENDKLITGWHYVDSSWYFFESNGILQTNKIIDNELPGYGKGKRYVNSTGKLVTGWNIQYSDINNNKSSYYYRYFEPSTGIMVADKTITISKNKYKFNKNGKLMVTGVKKMPKDARMFDKEISYYYFDKNSLVVNNKELINTKNGSYWLDGKGGVITDIDKIIIDNSEYENVSLTYYYPNSKTHLIQKNTWYKDETDGTYMYFGSDGKAVNGLKTIDGNLYYFDDYFMIFDDVWTVKNAKYYFDDDGKARKGWHKVSGKKYYFGNNFKAYSGLKKIGDNYYYFQKNKKYMITNDIVKIKDKIWYFKNDGKAQTGWQTVNKNRYYFDKNFNAAKGLQKIKSNYYYFDTKTGVMLTNNSKKVNKKLYYFGKDGKALKGWITYNGVTYYADKNYNLYTGLQKIKKKYYYFDTKTGLMLVNSDIKVKKVKYHCDKKGVCKKK